MDSELLPAADADPIDAFQGWYELARASEPLEGACCCLATADADARPSARMVLFRGLHRGLLSFYTNLESRKAAQLRENPRAALCFHWQALGRQIRAEGDVTRLSSELSDRYFATRPRGSQLGAWASAQSRPLSSRTELESRLQEVSARFAEGEVPRPAFWGGYGLRPERIEFWGQGEHRLHWRRCYTLDDSGWRSELLSP